MAGNGFLWIGGAFVGAFLAIGLFGVLGFVFSRRIVQWLVARFTKRLMSNHYSVNIWEMVTALTRINPILAIENSLRAESGAIIERPFGSPRKFLHFDGLMFSPAQLATFPRDEE